MRLFIVFFLKLRYNNKTVVVVKNKRYEKAKKKYIKANNKYSRDLKSKYLPIISTTIIFLTLFAIPIIFHQTLRKNNNIASAITTSNLNLSKKSDLTTRINELIYTITDNLENATYKTYEIGEYINVYIKVNNNHHSFLLAKKNGQEKTFSSILKPNTEVEFTKIINNAIDTKYPKFIADVIKTSQRAYEIEESKIIIYFACYEITPTINETLYVTINNHAIKEIINYTIFLDKDNIDENIVELDPNKPTVAITYDDGPTYDKTNYILDIFEENKMKATFFMLGQKMNQYPNLVKMAYSRGHEVGSHTYDHKYLTKIKDSTIAWEINSTNDAFRSITNNEIALLRPPYGKYNEHVLNTVNMPFIMWSIDTRDWADRDATLIVERTLNEVKDGDIILMHDSYTTTVEATRILLPELYARGFQVVTVSKLAELKGITLEPAKVYKSFK